MLVSALRLPRRKEREEGEREQERDWGGGGGAEGLGEWWWRGWGGGVVWTREVQRGGWVHCEDTTSLIMPSQSTLLLTGSPCKAHLP